jgi:hypothetical protein
VYDARRNPSFSMKARAHFPGREDIPVHDFYGDRSFDPRLPCTKYVRRSTRANQRIDRKYVSDLEPNVLFGTIRVGRHCSGAPGWRSIG